MFLAGLQNFPAAKMTEQMEVARAITEEFGDRRELVKGVSNAVAATFEDGTFDWI